MLIFLVGYMGSGKSTLGKSIARKLLMDFCDTDTLIEKSEGRSISDIFASDGEEYFRKKENELIKNFSAGSNFVVATGGGMPCFYDNMELMNRKGITIYLKINPGILSSRLLNGKSKRPIIADKNDEELREFIEKALSEREPYYEMSAYTVEGSNIKSDEIVELIKD